MPRITSGPEQFEALNPIADSEADLAGRMGFRSVVRYVLRILLTAADRWETTSWEEYDRMVEEALQAVLAAEVEPDAVEIARIVYRYYASLFREDLPEWAPPAVEVPERPPEIVRPPEEVPPPEEVVPPPPAPPPEAPPEEVPPFVPPIRIEAPPPPPTPPPVRRERIPPEEIPPERVLPVPPEEEVPPVRIEVPVPTPPEEIPPEEVPPEEVPPEEVPPEEAPPEEVPPEEVPPEEAPPEEAPPEEVPPKVEVTIDYGKLRNILLDAVDRLVEGLRTNGFPVDLVTRQWEMPTKAEIINAYIEQLEMVYKAQSEWTKKHRTEAAPGEPKIPTV